MLHVAVVLSLTENKNTFFNLSKQAHELFFNLHKIMTSTDFIPNSPIWYYKNMTMADEQSDTHSETSQCSYLLKKHCCNVAWPVKLVEKNKLSYNVSYRKVNVTCYHMTYPILKFSERSNIMYL